MQDGMFQGIPQTITQTTDGYLWIGTNDGLVRFDGVRFVPWKPPALNALPNQSIFSLLADQDGSLWIGTGRGLVHWTHAALVNYPESFGRINAIAKDRDDVVWIARTRQKSGEGPLCRVKGQATECFGVNEGLKCPYGAALAVDDRNDLWMANSAGICRRHDGAFQMFLADEFQSAKGLVGIQAIATTKDQSLWLGVPHKGAEAGLSRFDGKTLTHVPAIGLAPDASIGALFLDRNDTLWIGTVNQGVYRLSAGTAEHFSTADGLSGDAVAALYEDREGNIWAATARGLDRFRDTHVASLSMREGLSADAVDSVLVSRDGTIWIGNEGALDVLRDGSVSRFTKSSGLPGADITSMYEDSAGRIWIGVDRNMAVYVGGKFQAVATLDGEPVGLLIAIEEDSNKRLWALESGGKRNLIRFEGLTVAERISLAKTTLDLAPDPNEGLWLGYTDGIGRYSNGSLEDVTIPGGIATGEILEIHISSDESLWAATEHGLLRMKDGKAQMLGVRNGLPCEKGIAFTRDKRAALWLSTECGLVKIEDSELERWWTRPDDRIEAKWFDAVDGAVLGRPDFKPRVAASANGRLWFATTSRLEIVDPGRLRMNEAVPPVHIEQFIADRKTYAAIGEIAIPPLSRDLEIDYTALSFVVPERVRFRYRLEGYDSNWRDAGSRRQAFYDGLRPGSYRFHVIASNNDDLWNEDGAALTFTIAPAWYQTKWFYALALVSVLALIWGLHWLRLRALGRSLTMRFDERLSERTRIARDLHDTLLQTIQASKNVADNALDGPGDLQSAMRQVSKWLGQAMSEGRAALNSLRTSSTETNDLAAALKRVTLECRAKKPIEVTFAVEGKAREMHPVVRDEIYRIGYEAIRNACEHSMGSHLSVRLSYAHDLELHVDDNGLGIDPSIVREGRPKHFGLQGMRERAARIGAQLQIRSGVDHGTEVALRVPGTVIFVGRFAASRGRAA